MAEARKRSTQAHDKQCSCSICLEDRESKAALSKKERRSLKVCAACGARPQKLFVCSGCKALAYCGLPCQRKAWKAGHKAECKTMKETRKLHKDPAVQASMAAVGKATSPSDNAAATAQLLSSAAESTIRSLEREQKKKQQKQQQQQQKKNKKKKK
jgi:hypothetical protein